MEIYCKNNLLLDKAVEYANTLGISEMPAIISIKRLPPSFPQQGLIEHPRELDNTPYINIYVKLNKERYITLAHEMVHVRQVLNGDKINENEAYLLEKTLDNNHRKQL
tara:strand:- start:4275 stop:4598 length:324 start_codon:yes stop_codon:yes gene_type:complete